MINITEQTKAKEQRELDLAPPAMRAFRARLYPLLSTDEGRATLNKRTNAEIAALLGMPEFRQVKLAFKYCPGCLSQITRRERVWYIGPIRPGYGIRYTPGVPHASS